MPRSSLPRSMAVADSHIALRRKPCKVRLGCELDRALRLQDNAWACSSCTVKYMSLPLLQSNGSSLIATTLCNRFVRENATISNERWAKHWVILVCLTIITSPCAIPDKSIGLLPRLQLLLWGDLIIVERPPVGQTSSMTKPRLCPALLSFVNSYRRARN